MERILDKTQDQLLKGLKLYKRGSTVFFSFLLGGITSFFYRDEKKFPTFLRVKEAYLLNQHRLMQKPDERVLSIIDPTLMMLIY